MSLDATLAIAAGGLTDIAGQLAVVSQNVANAGTPDYAREIANQSSVVAGSQGMGVQTEATTRAINTQLQALTFQQNGQVAALQTTQTALQQIDAVQGSVGGGADLSSLLGKLQDAFSSLQTDPANQTQQAAVVAAASSLATQTNSVSTAIGTARQNAQNNLVAEVATLNASLASIGSLSDQIVALKAGGQSTASLENQRDAAIDQVSSLTGAKFLAQPNGDMLAVTASGVPLPLHAATPPFATQPAGIGAASLYPGGGIPAITLNGQDVTTQLAGAGGQIGANITLRDSTLPGYQGQLDEFAQTLSSRFSQQGLALFTAPDGSVPTGGGVPVQAGYVGYAGIIQVNPAVTATPALVRDGTNAVAGSPTGASAFTPNPAGGPAGSTTLIGRILNYALGTQAQAGVPQPAPAVTGLGAAGTLAAPYAPPADLAGFAVAVVSAQAADSAAATTRLGTENAVQTALQAQLSTQDGVSIDTEMSNMIQLQNAYGANAKVITAVQALWSQLLSMVN
jgi:flagellar hook-associated protein 1 FlgK